MYLLGTGVRDTSRLIDPRNPIRYPPPPRAQLVLGTAVINNNSNHTSPGGGCAPLIDGHILTGAQLTLSRHYRVCIWHGGVLGVHESLSVRDRFWRGRYSNPWVGRRGRVQSPSDF